MLDRQEIHQPVKAVVVVVVDDVVDDVAEVLKLVH